jgi:putative oxidoreductase
MIAMNTTANASSASTTTRPGRGLTIALWVVQVGLALMFLMAGGNKLLGNPMMVGLFDAIGTALPGGLLVGLAFVAWGRRVQVMSDLRRFAR